MLAALLHAQHAAVAENAHINFLTEDVKVEPKHETSERRMPQPAE